MPLSKCPRCTVLWNRTPESAVCETCAPDEEADREKVLDCISNNPGINADDIAEQTKVSVETIRRMLDDGVIAREVDLDRPVCGKCGAPAMSHLQQLCEKCLAELDKETMDKRRDLQLAIKQTTDDASGGTGGDQDNVSTREMLDEKR